MEKTNKIILFFKKLIWTNKYEKSLYKKDKIFAIKLLLPALITLFIIVIYPFLHSIIISFLKWSPISPSHRFVGINNYIKVITNPNFFIAIRNTFFYAIGGAVGKIIIGFALAMIVNMKFKGRGLARALLMLPWVVPITSAATTWRWMYDTTGIFNKILLNIHMVSHPINFLGDKNYALISILIVGIWRGYPMFMLMILAGLQSIPQQLYEAAEVDGANMWQKFWCITVPSLRFVLRIAIILSVIWSFNAFNLIWLMTKGGPSGSTHILNTLSYEFAFTRMTYGRAASLAVITLVLLAVFLYFYVKNQKEEI